MTPYSHASILSLALSVLRRVIDRFGSVRLIVACVAFLAAVFTPTVIVQADLKLVNSFGDARDQAIASGTQLDGSAQPGFPPHRLPGNVSAAVGPNGGTTCGVPGSLDPTFGIGGKATTAVGISYDEIYAVALQTDGKIVAGGDTQSASGYDAAVVRYNSDGSLDTAFGTGGIVKEDSGIGDFGGGVAVQADGRIVFGTFASQQDGLADFQLFRYNADGTRDQSFGTGGRVVTDFSNSGGTLFSVVIQADGKILASGFVVGSGSTSLAVVRYNTDGSLDDSFGAGGKAIASGSGSSSFGSAVIDPAGRIVVGSGHAVVRFNADGSLDEIFGIGGIASNNPFSASAMALQADGRIVLVGENNFSVGRLNADGSLDATFGTNGSVFTNLGDPSGTTAVSILRDGRIIAAGFGQDRFALARYNPNGSLDTSFGTNGTAIMPSPSGRILASVMQTDGRIVAAGHLHNGENNDFAVARYLSAAFCGPEITVAHPELTYLADNSSFNFGTGNVGTALPPRIYTIRNDGTEPLSLGTVTVTGANSGDVVVNTSGMAATLAPGAATTFTATFTPGGPGPRTASLRIENTDTDENPFDLNLTGRGLSGVDLILSVTSVGGTVTSNPSGINCPGDCSQSYDEGAQAVTSLTPRASGHYKFVRWEGDASGSTVPLQVSMDWNKSITAVFEPITLFDYDGDKRADLSVWRPSNSTWYFQTLTSFSLRHFGAEGDILTPADFDWDDKTDIALYRPSTGTWYWVGSAQQTYNELNLGQQGDIPIPMDLDLNGMRSWPTIFRPSEGKFIIYGNPNNQAPLGTGYKPVRGDFDGDGRQDLAVYKPSDYTWHIARSSGGTFTTTWGEVGDKVVPSDYDGDGATDIAIWRPSTGQWYIIGSRAGWMIRSWGVPGDIPVPADYDGDGSSDVAVFRPSNGTWYIMNSSDFSFYIRNFGESGDIPAPSSYVY